jgi:hypothetical protein
MKDQPAYIMDLEDIVRMRDLEIRKLKERVAELEGRLLAGFQGTGDGGSASSDIRRDKLNTEN